MVGSWVRKYVRMSGPLPTSENFIATSSGDYLRGVSFKNSYPSSTEHHKERLRVRLTVNSVFCKAVPWTEISLVILLQCSERSIPHCFHPLLD